MCASTMRSKQIGQRKSTFFSSTVELMPFSASGRLFVDVVVVLAVPKAATVATLAGTVPASAWTPVERDDMIFRLNVRDKCN